MTEIKILNNKFEAKSKMTTELDLSADAIKESAVHQVVKAVLAGRRSGNACTKTKGLVSGGGIKPFKQKGTGRARQGSTRSPLMVGGGTAFGPTPRDFSQKVNKSMKLIAIQSVLADKFQSGKLTVLDSLTSTGKTKEVFNMLSERGLLPALVVTADKNSLALRAVKNIRNANALPVDSFNVYEAVKYENLIIEKGALESLFQRLV